MKGVLVLVGITVFYLLLLLAGGLVAGIMEWKI